MSGVEFLPHQATPDEAPPPAPPVPPAPEPDPPTPTHRRRALGPRSLTARLVSGVVILVIVLVAAVGGGTYYALRSFLADRLDQQLQSTAGPQSLRNLLRDDGESGPGVNAPLKVWLVVLDPTTGAVDTYVPGYGIDKLALPESTRKRLAGRSSSAPLTVTTTTGGELRVTVRPVTVVSTGQRATLVVGLSTDEERKTLTRLVHFELLIGAAAILVAFVATLYGVRFSLRRLRRVTSTAQEVAAELSPTGSGLDRRVPVDEQGTEVGQLAASMNTLLSAVETQFSARLRSEARLRQFLADASHELRTPLTSIRGYAELARMQRAAGADADDNLARIESEGTRMSRLVEDLLTLARGEQPGSEPARELVDVDQLVDEAVSGARAAYPERTIEVDPWPDLHVIGDHDQLLRAIRNLITNAAVHTAPERPIRVRSAVDGEGVIVQVIDGGPGLPPEEAAHVFERFWRADKARSRARGGSGLGLAIVAAIASAHGGVVHFESSVERGSTVTIWLPGVRGLSGSTVLDGGAVDGAGIGPGVGTGGAAAGGAADGPVAGTGDAAGDGVGGTAP